MRRNLRQAPRLASREPCLAACRLSVHWRKFCRPAGIILPLHGANGGSREAWFRAMAGMNAEVAIRNPGLPGRFAGVEGGFASRFRAGRHTAGNEFRTRNEALDRGRFKGENCAWRRAPRGTFKRPQSLDRQVFWADLLAVSCRHRFRAAGSGLTVVLTRATRFVFPLRTKRSLNHG
jgi:hypothetical protein